MTTISPHASAPWHLRRVAPYLLPPILLHGVTLVLPAPFLLPRALALTVQAITIMLQLAIFPIVHLPRSIDRVVSSVPWAQGVSLCPPSRPSPFDTSLPVRPMSSLLCVVL